MRSFKCKWIKSSPLLEFDLCKQIFLALMQLLLQELSLGFNCLALQLFGNAFSFHLCPAMCNWHFLGLCCIKTATFCVLSNCSFPSRASRWFAFPQHVLQAAPATATSRLNDYHASALNILRSLTEPLLVVFVPDTPIAAGPHQAHSLFLEDLVRPYQSPQFFSVVPGCFYICSSSLFSQSWRCLFNSSS